MMAMTPVIPLYAADGIEVIGDPATATQLWSDASAWDSLILEMRQELVGINAALLEPVPEWTRGTAAELNDDAFYVSHVTDLRDYVNYAEFLLNLPETAWFADPIVPRYNSLGNEINPGNFTDVRDMRLIAELQAAIDRVWAALNGVLAATNVRVLFNGVEVGS